MSRKVRYTVCASLSNENESAAAFVAVAASDIPFFSAHHLLDIFATHYEVKGAIIITFSLFHSHPVPVPPHVDLAV